MRETKIDFDKINADTLAILPTLVRRWLPSGYRSGNEWVAINPRRNDRNPGSFKVNLVSGKWADFASDDRGGDPISLAAYLAGCGQAKAARSLLTMLGGKP